MKIKQYQILIISFLICFPQLSGNLFAECWTLEYKKCFDIPSNNCTPPQCQDVGWNSYLAFFCKCTTVGKSDCYPSGPEQPCVAMWECYYDEELGRCRPDPESIVISFEQDCILDGQDCMAT